MPWGCQTAIGNPRPERDAVAAPSDQASFFSPTQAKSAEENFGAVTRSLTSEPAHSGEVLVLNHPRRRKNRRKPAQQ